MVYAALFRGINVGGKNIVKMALLKDMFEGLGFLGVKTYIQSGNVVFNGEGSEYEIMEKISREFSRVFGFDSGIILRSRQELYGIIHELPFSVEEILEVQKENPDVEHVYIYLLNRALEPDELERLPCEGPDIIQAGKREIYLLCRDSVRDSKQAAALSKLKIPMTARNMNTMRKLCEMAMAQD